MISPLSQTLIYENGILFSVLALKSKIGTIAIILHNFIIFGFFFYLHSVLPKDDGGFVRLNLILMSAAHPWAFIGILACIMLALTAIEILAAIYIDKTKLKIKNN